MTITTDTKRVSASESEQANALKHVVGYPRPLRLSEKVLVSLEGFLSVCGLGGGIYLATDPLTAMPMRYLEGTWFHTWRWPGLALFFFVGVCPALAAAATVRRMPVALVGHLCVGIGMVGWIVLEVAWMVVSPPLQIVMGLVGLAILTLGIKEWGVVIHRRNVLVP